MAYDMLPSAACRTSKRVTKRGSCLSLGKPLRRSEGLDAQTCGVIVKCETSLPAATVCGLFEMPKHVVECEFLLGTGNPLQISRRSDIQTGGKMQKFGEARCSPSHKMTVNREKTGVKL